MLIIIDPSLRSYMGHFLTYDRVICEELKKRGQRSKVLASRAALVELMPDLDVIPCLRFGLEEPNRSKELVAEAFLEDLNEGASHVDGAQTATFFLHTCIATQIEPAARFIAQPQYANARLIILLRYSITINPLSPDAQTVDAYARALKSIEDYEVQDRVMLVSDSDLLAEEYYTVTDLPIRIVPIPHVGMGSAEAPTVPTIAYLGNARASKGFQYFPYLVSQIRTELETGQWRVELQANVMFKRDTESVVAVMALRNELVTLHERELSEVEYQSLLNRASLVVIPYWTLWYHNQTSGVFAEAIGAGKPVVVPRGTWMARELAGRAAGTLFFPGDRADLVRATRDAMRRIDELTAGARDFCNEWQKVHNPAAFVERLLALEASS